MYRQRVRSDVSCDLFQDGAETLLGAEMVWRRSFLLPSYTDLTI